MTTRTVDEYLALPYTIEVIRDESDDHPGWFARVVELPGCMTQAETFEELGAMIEDAMRAWIETSLEDGQPIPEPRPTETYSGKFVVRVPKSLHRELVEAADRDGVSLNAFINAVLGRVAGTPRSTPVAESIPANLPGPNWPQLSHAAWRAMLAAGLQTEAQTVNEQMFADWLENNMQQIEAALEIGAIQDAQWHLTECRQALRICSPHSPMMRVFHRTLTLLETQVNEANALVRERISAQEKLDSILATENP